MAGINRLAVTNANFKADAAGIAGEEKAGADELLVANTQNTGVVMIIATSN